MANEHLTEVELLERAIAAYAGIERFDTWGDDLSEILPSGFESLDEIKLTQGNFSYLIGVWKGLSQDILEASASLAHRYAEALSGDWGQVVEINQASLIHNAALRVFIFGTEDEPNRQWEITYRSPHSSYEIKLETNSSGVDEAFTHPTITAKIIEDPQLDEPVEYEVKFQNGRISEFTRRVPIEASVDPRIYSYIIRAGKTQNFKDLANRERFIKFASGVTSYLNSP